MIRRGMTVLELLVALTVTGLAASIGAATLALLADRRAPLLETASASENAAAARRTVIDWIEGAHAAPSPFSGNAPAVFQLLDRTVQGQARDELLFTTSAPTPLGKGDALVRLYVDATERTTQHGLVAELSEYPGGPGMRMQLDSTVTELDVRCLTDLVGTRRWVPSFLSSQVAPRGVELRLRSARADRLHPLLRLPIRVVVEAGR
ncbi:MAG TPA: prepilin-type N-terminal cleavage/methylation domain-containing protein [Gemmatimonadaceae bacterium]|nr:prepilin-type N-terminal cleavage/methylation domain-containing protein [Gemmatimonadaceae bacterium]